MSARPLVPELLAAVRELTTTAPHEPDHARFTRAEFVVFWRGYWMGVVMALRVMDATIVTHADRERGELSAARAAAGRYLRAVVAHRETRAATRVS